jgi:hypothetical protein
MISYTQGLNIGAFYPDFGLFVSIILKFIIDLKILEIDSDAGVIINAL